MNRRRKKDFTDAKRFLISFLFILEKNFSPKNKLWIKNRISSINQPYWN